MSGRKYPPGTPVSPSGIFVVKPPRRTWCSDTCASKRWDYDPNTLRSRALQRELSLGGLA